VFRLFRKLAVLPFRAPFDKEVSFILEPVPGQSFEQRVIDSAVANSLLEAFGLQKLRMFTFVYYNM